MKRIVVSREAESALDDILLHTARQWGEAQAETYQAQLLRRLESLASAEISYARSCGVILPDSPNAAGLKYVREGSHYLILRETSDLLELVEIFHVRMDLERHISALAARRRQDEDDAT